MKMFTLLRAVISPRLPFKTRSGKTKLPFLFAFMLIATCPSANAQSININGPVGSGQFGIAVTVLTNGNYVVNDPSYDNGAIANVGAVHLYNGITHALISTLTGSTANDEVGNNAVTTLSNGNYVISSTNWDNGALTNAGALTWCNGTTGINGVVSSSNSLVGSTGNDQIGNGSVTALSNGNYVVKSYTWDNGAAIDAGAVTWGNGTTGINGVVNSSNSLVGSSTSDYVGYNGVTALNNGHYVVISRFWNNGAATLAGAITWGNGTTGITGLVSSSNSLVGSNTNDQLGTTGITALSNGNYVVSLPNWDNGAIVDVGAVTWCNGTTGRTGPVTTSNSLVGSTVSDLVGNTGSVTALSNGNYVVSSTTWDNGAVFNAGAVTWGNGTSGTTGVVSSSNSLVGSTANDQVGALITALSNGNYVVSSPTWDNGAIADVGAATWGNGITGITGVINSSNSLVGSTGNDQIGNGSVTALSNGNYVVKSYIWDNGATPNTGAATWGNGTTGTSGVVSSSNSLVGSTANDLVGNTNSVISLSNGNYVVSTINWDNGATPNTGAATWGNGTTGTSGVVSSSNSLVGSTANDQVGALITALSNGNYVVRSNVWDNGAILNASAITWGNGTSGTTGVVNSSNSLVGSKANDNLGNFGVYALSNGNYVVSSVNWDNGAVTDAGAATWGNGTSGITGVVNSSNSLVGNTANDQVGISVYPLSNGNYVVSSPVWDNAAVINAGAVTWGNGSTGVTGFVTSCNSVIGTAASGGSTLNFAYNTVYPNLLVGRPADNIVTVFNPSGMSLANTLDAVTVNINGTNAVPLIASGACRIITTITPNGGATAIKGTVNAKVWIEPSVTTFNVLPFVARHFEITPATNPTTATSNVTLYFTQQEFDDFNAHPASFWNLPANAGDAAGKANLRVARYSGISSNGSGLPGTYTPGALVIDPVDADISWNSTLSRWEVSFDVSGFGGFILQTALYPLAVNLNFNGQLQNNNGLLNWRTANEMNIRSFILERSTDASHYDAIFNTAAFNTAGDHQYHFTDSRIDALGVAVVYYRLKQVDTDGRFTYSNIVALSPAGKNIVLLYPNPVQDIANLMITVNKAQQLQYSIIDNTGKIITAQKRHIESGSNTVAIDVSGLPKAVYWIELRGETLLERIKFIKK